MRGPLALALAAGTVGAVGVAAPAWAYWSVASSGATASAAAAALGVPGVGAKATSPTAVAVTVTTPSSGPTPSAYRVDRTSPSPTSDVCTVSGSSGTCSAAAVAGQTNTYAVYALLGSHWVSATPGTASATAPSADTTAPTTTASLDPTPNSGWNRGPVTVTLTAVDEAGGSGVKEIRYTLDGSAPSSSSAIYSSPLTVSTTTTVRYAATDNARNTETAKSAAVNIDTVAPLLTVTTPTAGQTAAGNGNSGTGTGTGSLGTVAEGVQSADLPTVTAVIYSGTLTSGTGTSAGATTVTITAPTWKVDWASLTRGQQYTLVVTQSDAAGNTTTVYRTFTQ